MTKLATAQGLADAAASFKVAAALFFAGLFFGAGIGYAAGLSRVPPVLRQVISPASPIFFALAKTEYARFIPSRQAVIAAAFAKSPENFAAVEDIGKFVAAGAIFFALGFPAGASALARRRDAKFPAAR